MKKLCFNFLIVIGFLSISACDNSGICSCGTACTVAADGALSCSLDAAALAERKGKISELLINKAEKVEETPEGYLFVLKDEGKMNEQLFDFILAEKKCCPFFQYDIKVLPYQQGIHLTVSGDEQVKSFLKNLVAF